MRMDVCVRTEPAIPHIGLSYHIHLRARCSDMFVPISVRAKIQTTRQQNAADNARKQISARAVDHWLGSSSRPIDARWYRFYSIERAHVADLLGSLFPFLSQSISPLSLSISPFSLSIYTYIYTYTFTFSSLSLVWDRVVILHLLFLYKW